MCHLYQTQGLLSTRQMICLPLRFHYGAQSDLRLMSLPSRTPGTSRPPKIFNSCMAFSHMSNSHKFVAKILDCGGSEHFYHCTKLFFIKLGILAQTCNRRTWDGRTHTHSVGICQQDRRVQANGDQC